MPFRHAEGGAGGRTESPAAAAPKAIASPKAPEPIRKEGKVVTRTHEVDMPFLSRTTRLPAAVSTLAKLYGDFERFYFDSGLNTFMDPNNTDEPLISRGDWEDFFKAGVPLDAIKSDVVNGRIKLDDTIKLKRVRSDKGVFGLVAIPVVGEQIAGVLKPEYIITSSQNLDSIWDTYKKKLQALRDAYGKGDINRFKRIFTARRNSRRSSLRRNNSRSKTRRAHR